MPPEKSKQPLQRLRSYRFALSFLMISDRHRDHDCTASARAKGLQAPWQPFTQAQHLLHLHPRAACRRIMHRAVTCPFCKTTVSCPLVSDSALQQFPCPSCAENLIVLNPEARSTDEDTVTVAPRTDGTTGNTDLSRRMAGIAVAVLACLLNYALLSGVGYWMFSANQSDPRSLRYR